MDSKFSTVNAVKRTPLVHREPPVPYMMWGNIPTRKRMSSVGAPMHPRIVGLGATLLIGAFATDVAYAQSDLFQWENFSIWLITAGLALAAAAAAALVFDAARHRIAGIDWARFCGFIGATLLSILNAFVHSRDAYTAVVPQGVILSGIVTAILLALGWWRGWSVGKTPRSSFSTEGTQS
jgi:uncharacterized membrane protein